jgi:tetratricopeptide (TPR) repeat protein
MDNSQRLLRVHAHPRAAHASALLLCAAIACSAGGNDGSDRTTGLARASAARSGVPASLPTAQEIVLAPHHGDDAHDRRIRALQSRIPGSKVPAAELERLGWAFVARARELADPGSYQLALQCALAIEVHEPARHGALLLRGHALQSLHRFREAEVIARTLVAERGLAFDLGLLGDVLADRGEVDEAIDAYQRMVDIRPDAHSYARAAHARYLKGDLPGAREAMTMAARAASPRNRETFAWTWARLAQLQLQMGDTDTAMNSVRRALERFPESPPALRLEAAIWLHRQQPARALAPLRSAARRQPHPDVLWMLLETAEAVDDTQEAAHVRAQLLAVGEREDARAFALYLATHGEQLAFAEQLVRRELEERKDVYTYEALAWVQSARGQHAAALEHARRSLGAGTRDPRLYYHAGLIAERAGDSALAAQWLAEAALGSGLLLPSQRRELSGRVQAPSSWIRKVSNDKATLHQSASR